MKFFVILLVFSLSLSSSLVWGQDSESNYYEISNAYLAQAKKFSCEIVNETVKEYSGKSTQQIKAEIETELEEIKSTISQTTDLTVKRDLELYAQSLEGMKKDKSPKKFVIKTLEGLCKVARFPVQNVSRGLSFANSAVFHTAMMPFSSLFNFFRGTFSKRDKQSLGDRSDTLYRMIGPKKGVPVYLLSSMAWTVPDMLLKFNPITLGINASMMIELITNYQCFNTNPTDTKKIKFCNTYDDLRDFFHKGNKGSFKLGKKLQKLLDKRIVIRRSRLTTKKFCSYKPEKQIKRAKQALNRNNYFQENEKIYAAQIILPIHKNDCTKILIQATDEESLISLKESMPKKLEGIEVIFKNKGEYLSEYYYSQEELSEMSIESKVCYDIEQSHYSTIAMDKMALYVNFMKSTLAPSILGRPQITEHVVNDENVVKGNVSSLRNIIFSIGPINQDYSDVEALLEENKQIIKSIKKAYKKLNRKKRFKDCITNIEKHKIDVQKIREAFKRVVEINSDPEIAKYKEMLSVKAFIKKQKRRLKLEWELIPTNNLVDVVKATESRDVGNIIVISHGKKSGYLVDSYGQEMPGSAFSNMSPSLMSLNFYSCYSQSLVEKYALADKIKNIQSFYKIRFITNVFENDFMDSSSFAPISAFGEYLYNLDKTLFYAKKGAQALQKVKISELNAPTYEQLCSADLSGLKVRTGSYSVALNKNYLGVINQDNSHSEFSYPCDYLQEGTNTLSIKNMINSGGSEIENLKSFSVDINGQTVTADDAKLKLNSFIKAKFERP